MKMSNEGLALIKSFEGLRFKAYPDPKTGAKPYTLGHGTTVYPNGTPVRLGDTCTEAQAGQYLVHDVAKFEDMINKYVTVPLTQGQFDALTSLIYNVGPGSSEKDGIIRLRDGRPSTLLRKLNAGDYSGASAEFGKWISPGSAVENGLRRRRAAEVALFNA